MDKTKDPLLEELHLPPLKRKGFTDQLRLRIESEIEAQERQKKHKSNRFWLPVWSGAALLAAMLVYMVYPDSGAEQSANQAISAAEEQPKASKAASAHELKSGLLIGLREDSADEAEDEYRTLWISPDEDGLEVKQEGGDLLIPYKMDFWRLEHLYRAEGESLRATKLKLSEPSMTVLAAEPVTLNMNGERVKIQFAGQEYVALQQESSMGESFKVTKLSSIAEGAMEPVSLNRLAAIPSQLTKEYLEWTIMRDKGSWVAHPSEAEEEGYPLSRTVVAHDRLCADWSEVERIEPNAIDAVCSPTKDMLAVFTEDEIRFYPFEEGIIDDLLLTVPLKDEEKMIMAEWATGDYVSKWDEWLKLLLP